MFFFSSRNKKIFLVAVIILALGALYQFVDKETPTESGQLTIPIKSNEHPQSELKSTPPTEIREQSTQIKPPVNEPAPVAKEKSPPAPDAWSLGDQTTAESKIPLPEGVSVYEPVTIDMENPAYPEPGEQRTMVMPGGERLQVNIKTKSINPNGDYTWRGHLEGHDNDYPVVMTYGNNSVFATVTTPKGSYTLVSVNGTGWIYKNPSEFELSKPGVSDSLEIPK